MQRRSASRTASALPRRLASMELLTPVTNAFTVYRRPSN